MTKRMPPTGELFSHVYLERGAPVQDTELFRRRLGGYVQSECFEDRYKLTTYLKTETGLTVSGTSAAGGVFYAFEDFFVKIPIQHVLNVITLVWRFLWVHHANLRTQRGEVVQVCPDADKWKAFVARVFREENLGYTVDDKCGVHFLVDQEFEHNRVSLLRGLDSSRYAGVRATFESAHSYLDSSPPDTKASVRAMFESLEILVKLMVDTRNLNKWVVENKLKELAQAPYKSDDVAVATIGAAFDGFAQWVHGLHNYRHGQGKAEPVAPPLSFAIFVLSSGAAYLRWLVELDEEDQKRKSNK